MSVELWSDAIVLCGLVVRCTTSLCHVREKIGLCFSPYGHFFVWVYQLVDMINRNVFQNYLCLKCKLFTLGQYLLKLVLSFLHCGQLLSCYLHDFSWGFDKWGTWTVSRLLDGLENLWRVNTAAEADDAVCRLDTDHFAEHLYCDLGLLYLFDKNSQQTYSLRWLKPQKLIRNNQKAWSLTFGI